MSLRNFYIECEIDGKKTKLSGGPIKKDGGLSIKIYQRNCGEKILAGQIDAFLQNDGITLQSVYSFPSGVDGRKPKNTFSVSTLR